MKHAVAQQIHSLAPARPGKPLQGAIVGRVVNIDDKGSVFVDFPGNTRGPLPARLCSAVAGRLRQKGEAPLTPILLLFEDNDPTRPIVVDYLSHTLPETVVQEEHQHPTFDIGPDNQVSMDGETVHFNAKEQIVLKCGKASITLTRAGKVIIRGAYLLNRSSGVNRIKGGSVKIN